MKKISIGVIGTGAVGCVLASTLSAHEKLDVEFAYNCHKGVTIDGMTEIDTIKPTGNLKSLVKCVDDPKAYTSKKDIIFLVCKSTHMAKYAENIAHQLTDNGFVVMLNNALVRSCLTAKLPINKIVGMFIEWSCVKLNDYQVQILSDGPSVIGTYAKDATPLAKLVCNILTTVSNAVYVENFNEYVLGRIILNSAISCAGAICGYDVEHLFENKYGRKIFVELIKEGYFAYTKVGIIPTDYDGKLDYDMFCSKDLGARLYRRKIMNFLQKYSGTTTSSILLDLQNNKTIELDYLLGKIIETAEKNGVNCPVSKKVYNKIVEIYKGQETIRPELLEIIYKGRKKDDNR